MTITPTPYYNHNTILRNVKPCTPSQAIRQQTQTHTITYSDITDVLEAWAEVDNCHRHMREAMDRFETVMRRVVVPL
jgi:hypothetical protein